jgi:hypothetical protein
MMTRERATKEERRDNRRMAAITRYWKLGDEEERMRQSHL